MKDDRLKPIVEDIAEEVKMFLLMGNFKPGVVMVIDDPGKGVTEVAIPHSEHFFSPNVDKATSIQSCCLDLMKVVNDKFEQARLLAVITVADMYYSKRVAASRQEADDIEANIKAGKFPSPSEDPERGEALSIVVAEKDDTTNFVFFYKRDGNAIIFDRVTSTSMAADIGGMLIGGELSRIFPEELKKKYGT
jgi:hypothetical protein